MLIAPVLLAPGLAAAAAGLPPPSELLLRSLERFERDAAALDQVVPAGEVDPAGLPGSAGGDGLSPAEQGLLEQLAAPAPATIPAAAVAVTIEQEVRLSLPVALALALRNSPALAQEVASVQERRQWLRSVRGRFWPELWLELGGGGRQMASYNKVWQDNAALYPAGSPFLVDPNGWNRIRENQLLGTAALALRWDLVNFERGAALSENRQELEAAEHRYANRLRQLQLEVSLSFYSLQLAQQLRRIRQAVVDNDSAVLAEVIALEGSGLVPRLDRLRAEAALQQSRYRLAQTEAQRRSRQRQLSNLLNVPFTVTLTTPEAVRLQPPWPLDLERTVVAGFRDNPELLALQAARQALLRQADRRAAELLPQLRLYARAGYGEGIADKPEIELRGCCAATNIPQLYQQNGAWEAGLELRWRLFDAGVSSGAAGASRAAADRTTQALAEGRNAIRQRLEAAFFDHRAALEQILAARASYGSAREAFRDVRARYQLGLANYTDVSDTIRLLTQAMEGVAESITLANGSYAQLLRELLPVPDQPGAPVSLPLVLPAAAAGESTGS
ncbi:TolC family protein [Synechococcus sp. CS-1328]|uniref:TolC family protein n=1 Tax=Synechococcus sp. CS-1328 TaxID=2847976 RepID=UPI00223C36C1|nr:TolC family protein [Synechococcus sp. CS-1328]